jgi:hypothetical protein
VSAMLDKLIREARRKQQSEPWLTRELIDGLTNEELYKLYQDYDKLHFPLSTMEAAILQYAVLSRVGGRLTDDDIDAIVEFWKKKTVPTSVPELKDELARWR